jgi:acetaldehyde dehydrogenase (acetylating)
MGHTASIHTESRDAAREYGIRMPASRVVVNSPSTHGAIGFTTDLEPSMTLGCGSWGGNVTSDNISPRHLVDIKRIAFETRPINQVAATSRPAATPGATVDRAEIAALVDRFLSERHIHQPAEQASPFPPPTPTSAPAIQPPAQQASAVTNGASNGRIYDFVCEEDVKRAIASREKIYVNSKTIITPAARELGEERDVFARP